MGRVDVVGRRDFRRWIQLDQLIERTGLGLAGHRRVIGQERRGDARLAKQPRKVDGRRGIRDAQQRMPTLPDGSIEIFDPRAARQG